MDKFRAFLFHFTISAIIILIFLSVVYFIWYPGQLLIVEGGLFVIVVLVGVDLVLGPVMTAIVYQKGKKGLVLDLSIIVAIQIVALAYGAFTIMAERPQYLAFVVDRFVPVPAAAIDTNELLDKDLYSGLFSSPKLVYVDKPKGNKGNKERQELMMTALAGGKDRQHYPNLYRKYTDYSDLITSDKRQLDIDRVINHNASKFTTSMLESLKKKYNLSQNEMVFYPIQGKKKDMLVVLKKVNGDLLAILDLDPWY